MEEKKVQSDPWGLAINIFNIIFTIVCLGMGCFWQAKNIAFRKFKYVAPLFPYLEING